MFTGIIEEVGTIERMQTVQSVMTLSIRCQTILEDMQIGDSISVNGTCLTVTAFDSNHFDVQVIKGTESKTYLNQLSQGDPVNLERAMSGQGRFGGHFVLGHVDDIGRISRIEKNNNSTIITIQAPQDLLKQMVSRGSIAVDGTSLTIFQLRANEFDIHLIPETRHATILDRKRENDLVHLETDMLFKYVERIIGDQKDGLSEDKMKALGY
ncbi:riboflavin synthase [Staphylococcus pettenkoferi]|uniref:Riboflavin synthase n=1 Tax=Staphylococcus pettenkoferi TaxID=170573 RepID=A0A9Q4D4L0_9STAP|nr:riboflavin synthase [Staphylococcus pettenkoferi]MCY1568476.1 riboflavin synthase [Staphylococcus pettenkoferi]MCY1576593.1 riboflavin synthase [Staphylococcus pettenkoferi]MCY1594218.1 riboflavin synthase [Staphylococcus pettenkoferi]MCY1617168.1 riboflavin synthase [Staphylococcus pettenkoferi]